MRVNSHMRFNRLFSKKTISLFWRIFFIWLRDKSIFSIMINFLEMFLTHKHCFVWYFRFGTFVKHWDTIAKDMRMEILYSEIESSIVGNILLVCGTNEKIFIWIKVVIHMINSPIKKKGWCISFFELHSWTTVSNIQYSSSSIIMMCYIFKTSLSYWINTIIYHQCLKCSNIRS